jgi:hypothetical protein
MNTNDSPINMEGELDGNVFMGNPWLQAVYDADPCAG